MTAAKKNQFVKLFDPVDPVSPVDTDVCVLFY